MNTTAKELALGGMFTALGVVLLCLGGVVPLALYACLLGQLINKICHFFYIIICNFIGNPRLNTHSRLIFLHSFIYSSCYIMNSLLCGYRFYLGYISSYNTKLYIGHKILDSFNSVI